MQPVSLVTSFTNGSGSPKPSASGLTLLTEKPYYLTQKKTPEDLERISREKKRGASLIAKCFVAGVLFTAVFFWLKTLRRTP
jgi:hypothetical protein